MPTPIVGADFTHLCFQGCTARGLRWRLGSPKRVPCLCLCSWICSFLRPTTLSSSSPSSYYPEISNWSTWPPGGGGDLLDGMFFQTFSSIAHM